MIRSNIGHPDDQIGWDHTEDLREDWSLFWSMISASIFGLIDPTTRTVPIVDQIRILYGPDYSQDMSEVLREHSPLKKGSCWWCYHPHNPCKIPNHNGKD